MPPQGQRLAGLMEGGLTWMVSCARSRACSLSASCRRMAESPGGAWAQPWQLFFTLDQ